MTDTYPDKRNRGHLQFQKIYVGGTNAAAPATADVEIEMYDTAAYLNFIFMLRGVKVGITPQLLALDGNGNEHDITPGTWGAVAAGGIGYYTYDRMCPGPMLKLVLPANDDSVAPASTVHTFMAHTPAARYRS